MPRPAIASGSCLWFLPLVLASNSTDIFPLPTSLSPFAIIMQQPQLWLTNMFSFLWPWASHSSQPPPLKDKDDPTGGPPRTTVCPSPTGSDHHHYLSNPDLYQGPIDVTPADMPELFDILLSDIDEKVLHDEISTELGSAYLLETPHLTSPYTTINGIVFGDYHRVLFPLVVRLPRKPHSYVIHFLYDSGSPFSYLSQEVCGAPKPFTSSH